MSDARAQARANAQQGIALLTRALNYFGDRNVAYRYAPEVLAEFEELAGRIVALVEHGRIVRSPVAMARADADFQRLLGSVLHRSHGSE